MRDHRRIGIVENRRRVGVLERYLCDVRDYFAESERPARFSLGARGETDESLVVRSKLNRESQEVHDIVLAARVAPIIVWTPPPMVGGRVQTVDLIDNLYHLGQFEIGPQPVIDCVERAIGIYESGWPTALLRSVNPFFYLGLLLGWVAGLPFVLAGRVGLNRQSLEESPLGRVVKGIVYLAGGIVSFLTVLQLLGYFEGFREWLRIAFRF